MVWRGAGTGGPTSRSIRGRMLIRRLGTICIPIEARLTPTEGAGAGATKACPESDGIMAVRPAQPACSQG